METADQTSRSLESHSDGELEEVRRGILARLALYFSKAPASDSHDKEGLALINSPAGERSCGQ